MGEYAQNSLRKPATGITPFQCILGYQPPLFPWSGEPSNVPAVNDWIQRSEETWNQAHLHLRHAVRRNQVQADRHRRHNPEYHVGQWVWLSARDLRLHLPCRKLSPRYVGPFQITRQITPVSFELNLPNHYRISPTFHVSLLKPANGPGEGPEEPLEDADPLPISREEEEIYQVWELLDSRHRGCTLQYLVDWEGYGPEERSWVDTEDILDPSLVEEFHRDHPERPAPRPRGRPRRRPPPRFRSRSQGGLCHAERSYGSLSWSSTGTITRVLVWLHLPAAPYLVLIICHTCRLLPGLFNQSSGTGPVQSLVLPWLTFPSVFPSVFICVLPGLLTLSPDRLLPASLTPPAYWLSSLSAACPDPLPCLCLRICLVYVALDTTVWYLPVWPPLCINKAADGSQRHWPIITHTKYKNRNWNIMWQMSNKTYFSTIYILVRFITWFYSIDAVPLSSPHCRTLVVLIWTNIKLLWTWHFKGWSEITGISG